jgi:hypothetical protein
VNELVLLISIAALSLCLFLVVRLRPHGGRGRARLGRVYAFDHPSSRPERRTDSWADFRTDTRTDFRADFRADFQADFRLAPRPAEYEGEQATVTTLPVRAPGLSLSKTQPEIMPRAESAPQAVLRMVTAARTGKGHRGRSGGAHLLQEELAAVAHGAGGSGLAGIAAALALGTVVAARPQHTEDLRACALSAHRALRTAVRSDPTLSGLVSTLDVIALTQPDHEYARLRYVHVGSGAIWWCPYGGAPELLTTPHSFGDGPLLRGVGLGAVLNPDSGVLSPCQGDRVVLVSGAGSGRAGAVLAGLAGTTAGDCLDRLLAELGDDCTAVVADIL